MKNELTQTFPSANFRSSKPCNETHTYILCSRGGILSYITLKPELVKQVYLTFYWSTFRLNMRKNCVKQHIKSNTLTAIEPVQTHIFDLAESKSCR